MSNGGPRTIREEVREAIEKLYTNVPQDRSGKAGRVQMNLRMTDIFGCLLFAAIVFTGFVALAPGFSVFHFVIAGLAFIGPLVFIVLSPDHDSPEELISKNIRYYVRQIRMPLCSEAAWDIPGLVDVHHTLLVDDTTDTGDEYRVGVGGSNAEADWNARTDDGDQELAMGEQDDGAIVAYVRSIPNEPSQDDPLEWAEVTKDLSRQLNRSIGRADSDGFETHMKFSRTPPTPYGLVEDLEHGARGDAQTNEKAPARARRSAAERSEFLLDWTADTNVMEPDLRFAIPVYPDEGGRTNPIRDVLVRHTSLIRPTETQRDEQIRIAKRRAILVSNALATIGQVEFVDRNELMRHHRQFWLDLNRESEWDWTAQTACDARLPRAEYSHDGDPDDEHANSSEFRRRTQKGTLRQSARNLRTHIASSLSDTSRLHSTIAPAYLNEQPKHIEVNDRYAETIWVNSLPLQLQMAQLQEIETVPGVEYYLSAHLDTEDYQDKLEAMSKKRKWMSFWATVKTKFFQRVDSVAPIGGGGAGGVFDERDDLTEEEDELGAQFAYFRDVMKSQDLEAFSASIAITVRGDTLGDVRTARERIEDRLDGDNISVARAVKHQLAGLVTCSPSAKNALASEMVGEISFEMTTDGVSCLVPRHGNVRQDSGGVVLGMAKTAPGERGDALGLLQVDHRSLATGHTFVVGDSGDGKTSGMKQDTSEELIRHYLEQNDRQGLNTIIFDITRQYDALVEAWGGTRIALGDTKLNPFDLRPPAYNSFRSAGAHLSDRKRLITMMFYVLLKENASDSEAKALNSSLAVAVSRTFDRLGFEQATVESNPQRLARRSPVMADFEETLNILHERPADLLGDGPKAVKESVSADAKVLLNRLKQLWQGNDYDFFWVDPEHADDYDEIADIYAPVVYFEATRFKNASSSTIEMLVLYLMSHGQELSNFTGRETRTIADEAHKLFRDVGQAGRLEEFVLSGRNDGQNFTFISQADEHFSAESALVIAKQCRSSYWYSLGLGISTDTAERFGWSPAQAGLFDSLTRADDEGSNYAECLVDIDGETYLIERRMDPYNLRLLDYREHEHGDIDEYMRPLEQQPAPDSLSAGPVVDDYHANLLGARGHGHGHGHGHGYGYGHEHESDTQATADGGAVEGDTLERRER